MNHLNLAKASDTPTNIPVKRKRGRPRKDQSLNRREVARMPPGFEGVKGNQIHQQDTIGDANGSIVGQAVTGVVEAAFDGGYLLSVRIGNSNTSLSGVVFKPGHYAPISTANDVAPHVQMIRRTEIPIPMEKKTRRRRRSKVRMEQHDNLGGVETGLALNGLAPLTAALMSSKGKHVSPVLNSLVPPVGSRGTVVPVVLQPVNLSNGFLPANQAPQVNFQAPHIAAAKHNQVPAVAGQLPPLQPQTSSRVTPVGLQNENGPRHQGSNGKSSAEDSGRPLEGDHDNVNQPLSVEPLQIIHSNIQTQSIPVPKPSGTIRMGRMTALLQALQENVAAKNGDEDTVQ